MNDTAAIADRVSEMGAGSAYALLEADRTAVLVDVRTAAEWQYVGVPDLSALGKEVVFVDWQTFPSMQKNVDFVASVSKILAERGVSRDAPVLFICRSGARSLAAARALSEAGYKRCVNVAGGFEGPADASRQRGRLDGWKANNLPWVQS